MSCVAADLFRFIGQVETGIVLGHPASGESSLGGAGDETRFPLRIVFLNGERIWEFVWSGGAVGSNWGTEEASGGSGNRSEKKIHSHRRSKIF